MLICSQLEDKGIDVQVLAIRESRSSVCEDLMMAMFGSDCVIAGGGLEPGMKMIAKALLFRTCEHWYEVARTKTTKMEQLSTGFKSSARHLEQVKRDDFYPERVSAKVARRAGRLLLLLESHVEKYKYLLVGEEKEMFRSLMQDCKDIQNRVMQGMYICCCVKKSREQVD